MRFFSKSPDLDPCPTTAIATPGPAIPTPTSILPTYHINTKPSPSHPSTSRKATASTTQPPTTDAEKLRELLEKYDPRPTNLPDLWPMSEHRDMIRTMFLDNILYATARLHRHNWILGAENESYRDLCGKERWDLIHEDLERYSEFAVDEVVKRVRGERKANSEKSKSN
jgi:hypothetical protein